MTKTDTEQTQTPSLPGWFDDACSLFTARAAADRRPRLRGAPPAEPNPAKASLPDLPVATGMVSEDWDLLFRAVLEILARVAVEKPIPGRTGVQLQRPGDSLRGCLEALDYLRRSAPAANSAQVPELVHTHGSLAGPARTPPVATAPAAHRSSGG